MLLLKPAKQVPTISQRQMTEEIFFGSNSTQLKTDKKPPCLLGIFETEGKVLCIKEKSRQKRGDPQSTVEVRACGKSGTPVSRIMMPQTSPLLLRLVQECRRRITL